MRETAADIAPTPANDEPPVDAGAAETMETTEEAGAPLPKEECFDPERSAVIGVVIVEDGRGASPEAAIRSAGEGRPVVYATSDASSQAAAIARRAGATIAEIDGREPVTGGRARNAGYRQLKALAPDIDYVQFLVAGSAMHPDWLASAARFMARRPEVAVVAGATGERYPKPSIFAAAGLGASVFPGEAQAVGPLVFARVEGFETAGGFRNDLVAGETDDLCLRLRRRGRHVWRLDAPMAVREMQPSNLGGWWRSAVGRGFDFAYAAALHGRAPERYRALETARAVFWGGLYPAIVFGAAAACAGAIYVLDLSFSPLLAAAAIIALGCSVYVGLWLWIALRRGVRKSGSGLYGFFAALRHVPEFFGVLKFWLGPNKPSREKGSAA